MRNCRSAPLRRFRRLGELGRGLIRFRCRRPPRSGCPRGRWRLRRGLGIWAQGEELERLEEEAQEPQKERGAGVRS